ncbi:MAG: NAD-dependent epimerase/dehydratase family protein, partial [Solirubrobacteraceae bacterium]
MRILIIGAAGMVGRKLTERLARDGSLGRRPLSALTLADLVAAPEVAGGHIPVETIVADVAEPGVAADLVAQRPDVIVDLAAVVSGEAES